ncbi:hypothetical protein Tco_1388926 [Tanacetum coccineum]
MSDLPLKKMPSESELLQLFVKLDKSIGDLQTKIDRTLLKDRSSALIYDDQDVLRQFYKTRINEILMLEKEKVSNKSKDIKATIEQRIKILKNDFKRAKAQYVNLDLKCNIKKEKMAFKNANQKTYAYADVRAKNQDLLMTIFELKAKLIVQAKNMNTKFDKSATLEKLDCVTPLNKNKDLKATTVSKVEKKEISDSTCPLDDSGYSKHITGNLKLLRNFIEKFMGTVRLGNNNFTAITGYGDYVQGNLTICHMHNVEGLEHNLFSMG